jgi:hypothetical protein
MTLMGTLRPECVPARRARACLVDVAAAMRVKRCRAVRAHDLQILDAVVVADAVDVVEDQRQTPSAPNLTLAAEFALRGLETGLVQPLLQLAARERRPLNENLR